MEISGDGGAAAVNVSRRSEVVARSFRRYTAAGRLAAFRRRYSIAAAAHRFYDDQRALVIHSASGIDGFRRVQRQAVMVWRWLKALRSAAHGAALVESAIILPVFLALVGGLYEFGFFLYQEQLVTAGVRDATRYLTLTDDPASQVNDGKARNLAVTGSVNGGAPRVRGWTPSDVSISVNSVDNSDGTYAGGSTVQIVTVATSFADPTLGFLGLLGLKNPTISASYQERYIGTANGTQG